MGTASVDKDILTPMAAAIYLCDAHSSAKRLRGETGVKEELAQQEESEGARGTGAEQLKAVQVAAVAAAAAVLTAAPVPANPNTPANSLASPPRMPPFWRRVVRSGQSMAEALAADIQNC